MLFSSVAPQQAELTRHRETRAAEARWARLPAQAGEGTPPSPCPPTPYLLLPLHRTQNTFHTSVGFNLSRVIQMDPGEVYTGHITGKSSISCFKAELVKYLWQVKFHQSVVFYKAVKLPRDVSV